MPLAGLRARRGGRSARAPCPWGPLAGPPPEVEAPPPGALEPPFGRPPGTGPGPLWLFGLGGCAGLARSRRSSRGARSKRRMIEFISSAFGASMNVQSKQFGMEEVHRIIKTAGDLPAKALGEKLVAAVKQHASGRDASDDWTVVVIQRSR